MRSLFKRPLFKARGSGLAPLFILPLFAFLPLNVSSQRRERLIDTWKPLHYEVKIALNDQLSEITSAVTKVQVVILKNNVSTIDLDFGDLTINAVKVGGVAAQFERKPERLNVLLAAPAMRGDKLDINVNYHGRPKDGLVLTTDREGKPSATGDNWPNRVHHWIPSLDHPSAKATVTFTVTAPARDLVVANGAFAGSTSESATTRTWTFNETRPIPPYCMVIVVNEGARIDVPGAVTPLSYYVPQLDRAYAIKGFAPAPQSLSLFSQIVGPYPYEKLAMIVGATRFGGMENSSAIVFSSNVFVPNPKARLSEKYGIPVGIVDVVAHEIAHQWFGDSVTEATWADLWLSEGFATYYAGVFIQRYESEEAFQRYMSQAAETYLAYWKRNPTPIFDRNTEDLFKLLNGNNYQKGAWVLHMLRSRLGDDAFFRGVRDYYNSHRDSIATSEDLRMALERASGKKLKVFFDRWIYGSGHPVYELSSTQARAGSLTLVLKQVQVAEAFLDPVIIEVTAGETKKRLTMRPRNKLETLSLKIKGSPTTIVVDPDGNLLKEVVSK
ncbi:MAG: M1 family metallopeptidase [Pyrinomonadaceae bacterium]